jgi:hypothetical protein
VAGIAKASAMGGIAAKERATQSAMQGQALLESRFSFEWQGISLAWAVERETE